MWTTVAAYREPYEAHLLRGRLEAEGIPAIVSHECHAGVDWVISTGLGGAKVQVPEDFRQDARQIENLCREGEFRAMLEDTIGDLDEVKCPNCGSGEYRKRRPIFRAAIAIALSLSCNTVFPPLGWIHRCEGCGREYWPPRRPFDARKWFLVALTIVAFLLFLFVVSHWLYKVFGCPSQSLSC